MAMATANDLLLDESWDGASIRDLLARTLAPFGIANTSQFQLAGPDVRLPSRLAVALALAVHELATNASKYGALSCETGGVQLSWDVVTDEQLAKLHIRWTEAGGPPVSPPQRTGFGTKLIERVLAQEMGGHAKIEYRRDGLVFRAVASLLAPDSDARA